MLGAAAIFLAGIELDFPRSSLQKSCRKGKRYAIIDETMLILHDFPMDGGRTMKRFFLFLAVVISLVLTFASTALATAADDLLSVPCDLCHFCNAPYGVLYLYLDHGAAWYC